MRGKVYSKNEKEMAKKMVLMGKSYGKINEELGIPKSTLSTWFGKTLKKPVSKKAMLEHLSSIRKLASDAVKNKWARIRSEEDRAIELKIKEEIEDFPLDNIGFQKSLLAMLYWAEGAKYKGVSGLNFVNTDPKLLRLYITLLRKCYKINESKFRIRLHVHYYHKIKQVKDFWSKNLNVPLNQFNKVYIKKRSVTKRFRQNFRGICFVKYGDNKIRKELLGLGILLSALLKKSS